jgi:hypothetical protein
MVTRRRLPLSGEQQAELIAVSKHDPSPQMRERAIALLKIAGGKSPHWVALHGLSVVRNPYAVYHWLSWYETGGIAGLRAHLHGGSARGRLRRRAHSGATAGPTRAGGSDGAGDA